VCSSPHENHRVQVASCNGIPQPVQQESGLHLPSCTLQVRGEAHGRARLRIHNIPSPRLHNRLAHLFPPFGIGRHVTYGCSTAIQYGASKEHVHAHSSKSFVSAVIFGCFPRPPNTTDVLSTRMTCCASCHIAHIAIVVPRLCRCISRPYIISANLHCL